MEMLPIKRQNRDKGQALLIVLLSMAVVLTAVLSVSSRSVTDIQVTTYEEDALRAFSAAEAGVEQSLLKESNVSKTYSGTSVSYDSTIDYVTSPGSSFDYPVNLASGEVATFWFISHDPANPNKFLGCSPDARCTRTPLISVCWGDDVTDPPALVISIFYDTSKQVTSSNNYSNIEVYTETFDPNSSRKVANNFGYSGGTGCPWGNYEYQTGSINLATALPSGCAVNPPSGCLLMAKVKMLYNSNSQPVGLRISGGGGGNGSFPSQGLQISSEGTAGDVTRKVNVLQGYPLPPVPFENVLFSHSDIKKP
jgi:hypothetical protein